MKRTDNTTKPADKKTIIYAALIIIIIIVPTVFVLQLIASPPKKPKAAIIDQLSSSHLSSGSQYPNQTFVDLARSLLGQRFDTIDYYSDNGSVENYKQLPSRGYKVIVWRAHSALNLDAKYMAISTSERELQTGYDQYIQNGQLTLCNITDDPYLYYAINPKFIREVMSGRFEDTVIIMMSCNGLKADYTETAVAFQDKGAKVLISWDGWISSPDNDDATAHLLNYLVAENNTIGDAVSKIPTSSSPEFGPSTLHYFPAVPTTSNYYIPDYREVAQARTQSIATTAYTPTLLKPSPVRAFLRMRGAFLTSQALVPS
jgi:hypothetical protein